MSSTDGANECNLIKDSFTCESQNGCSWVTRGSQSDSDDADAAAVLVLVLILAVVGGLIGGGVWLCLRRRKSQRQDAEQDARGEANKAPTQTLVVPVAPPVPAASNEAPSPSDDQVYDL